MRRALCSDHDRFAELCTLTPLFFFTTTGTKSQDCDTFDGQA